MLGANVMGRFDGPEGGDESPGGWWFLFEPELHFDRDVIVPDIAGWRRDRVPMLPDAPWFDVAPDWVCEVISPSTESIDRGRKLRIYAREGVSHLWLLNPVAKTLEVYRLADGNWILVKTLVGDEVVLAEAFRRRRDGDVPIGGSPKRHRKRPPDTVVRWASADNGRRWLI